MLSRQKRITATVNYKEFDDGDHELTRYIFPIGTRVNAAHKRGLSWYRGVVVSHNRDGTYTVEYRDGSNSPNEALEEKYIELESPPDGNYSSCYCTYSY